MTQQESNDLLQVLQAINRGDFARQLEGDSAHAREVNRLVDRLNNFAFEATRISRETGSEGLFGGQMEVPGAEGTWRDLVDNLNLMVESLTIQVRATGKSVTALANGEFGLQLTYPAKGEVQELFETLNMMSKRLARLAEEVSRIAREVGVEGRFGGQAEVAGLSGGWQEMVENVNLMARNLTDQVRDIANTTKAIAQGDRTRRATVPANGETKELKEALNALVER